MASFATPPPIVEGCKVDFNVPHILIVTINREKAMNSIPYAMHWHMHNLFKWFDAEPSMRVAIITGAGDKAFCAGQDLIELGRRTAEEQRKSPWLGKHPDSGFAGISRRTGKKPIIAAVNGFALGGGFEIVLNCDLIVASPTARFGLPEALRGIYAGAGGLPRLVRNVGLPLATEIALTGRQLTATEALEYHLINKISKSRETVLEEAIEMAARIGKLSPDAVIVTRAGLRDTWETASVERSYQLTDQRFREGLIQGQNAKEGLQAFAEKREPKWVPSKL